MAFTPTPITLPDLTEATTGGTGVFDVLMRAAREHLDCEFKQNRIKGPEYATVYLGSLTQVLQTAVQFLLEKDKAILNAELIAAQVALANAQKAKVDAEILLIGVEKQKAEAELLLLQQQLPKIAAEIALMTAQTAKVEQDTLNAVTEGANLTKQGVILDVQDDQIVAQTAKVTAETALVDQNTANAVTEGANLIKQGCVLDAQFDLISQQVLKTTQETALMLQKVATERAQTVEAGVDDNSVVGKQKALYGAQAAGFTRNAEQEAAKIMLSTWSVRRTTDEATPANSTNKLDDTFIGPTVTKLLTGVGVNV